MGPAILKRTLATLLGARERRRQIRYRAFHDQLTGMPNRYLFAERLEQAIADARRTGRGFALVYADVDRFKCVNDSFGHMAGDMALRHIATCLASQLHAEDLGARLGGDEFGILLLQEADAAGVLRRIGRMEEALRHPVRVADAHLALSCSFGFSLCPDDGEDGEQLLWRSDQSMYVQKRRNRLMTEAIAAGSQALAHDAGTASHCHAMRCSASGEREFGARQPA